MGWEDEGEEEKGRSTGKGHWNRINGGVLREPGQSTLQGEIRHVQRRRNMKRAVRSVGWQVTEYDYSMSCVEARGVVMERACAWC